jgi:hypothetical protein
MAPCCGTTNGCNLDDETDPTGVDTTTAELMEVSPSGGASFTNLPGSPSTNGYPFSLGSVIPDGNGGALATSTVPFGPSQGQVQISDVGGSGGTATLSLNTAQPDMVLGDQGTYFTSDGNQVIDVNEADGNQLWTWQPSQGTVQIIAATAGGGVAVKNIVGNQEDVVRFDSTGSPTYDTWGTAGGSAGYGVLSNSAYFANDLWIGTTGDPVISGMIGNLLPVANDNWPWGTGGGAGDHEGQAVGPPALKLQAIYDCTQPDPAAGTPQPYERDLNYQLVDLHNNKVPISQQYTVYEKLSPYVEFTACMLKGNHTGISPCEPANGDVVNSPYNVYIDQISLSGQSVQPQGIHNSQSFFYQLPGQRWWPVLEIDRWGGQSNPWIKPVQGSSLDLFLVTGKQPLINLQGYPYMAPASSPIGGVVKNCNGQPPSQSAP